MKKSKKNKHPEFSKVLLRWETALIWIISLAFLFLAFYCIREGFTGNLPWLAAMVGFPWTAYGVSQGFYYTKSRSENTQGGIKYDTVMLEAQKIASMYQDSAAIDVELFADGVDPTAEVGAANNSIENVDDYRI